MKNKILQWILISFFGLLTIGLILIIKGIKSLDQIAWNQAQTNQMWVRIYNPQLGSKFEVNSWVPIEVQADGQYPIHKLELLVNDQVVEARGAPFEEGIRPFNATFYWIPKVVGNYILSIRITYGRDSITTKGNLSLEIVDREILTEADIETAFIPRGDYVPSDIYAGEEKITPDSPFAMTLSQSTYLPLPLPNTDDSILIRSVSNPKPWNPGLGQLLTYQFGDPSIPAAPIIEADTLGCDVIIYIQDQSDNELGFHVYRRSPGLANFLLFTSLNGSTGKGFQYTDPGLQPGSYSYYISAFNQEGEKASNIISVEILNDSQNNTNCHEGKNFNIEVENLKFETSIDRGYCYYSFDQRTWNRHPTKSDEFLSPTSDGKGLEGLDTLPRVGGPSTSYSLDLDCWGWKDGNLLQLGYWRWDQLKESIQPGISVEEIGNVNFQLPPQAKLSPEIMKPKTPPSLPINFHIPTPTLWIGTDPQECADYSNIPNPIIKGLICGDVADDIGFALWKIDQDYWNHNYCPQEPCFTTDNIIGYNVYDSATYKSYYNNPELTIDAPMTIHFIVDQKSCYARELWVTALVNYEGQILQSPPSTKVYYPGNPDCAYILGEGTKSFLLNWETIDFSVGNIDDGVDIEDDAEGYGWLSVNQFKFNLSELGWSGPITTVIEDVTTIDKLGVYEFEDDEEDNPYYWVNIPLWQSWKICQYLNKCNPTTGQNTKVVQLSRYGYIWVTSFLLDADPGESDDYICVTDAYIYATWVENSGGSYSGSMSASHPDASCVINFSLTEIDE